MLVVKPDVTLLPSTPIVIKEAVIHFPTSNNLEPPCPIIIQGGHYTSFVVKLLNFGC